jgi:hypothetical protein
MNSIIRRTLVVATGIAALGASSLTSAGIADKLVERVRERSEGREQSERQPQQQSPRQDSPRQDAPRQESPRQQAPQAQRAPAPQESRPNFRNLPERSRAEPAPAVVQSPAPRNQSPAPRSQPPAVAQRSPEPRPNFRNLPEGARAAPTPPSAGQPRGDRNGGTWRNDHRSPRVVQRLPSGYRNYNWNGRPYYTHGGRWYQPYGSSYIAIGVPYGLFVSTLPGYSSSFYFGNSRYYYYDDTYYTYEPVRRGYVVTRSPYNDDEDEDYYDDALDEDMYVYPSRGQSEQQQADDRYECHRWAVSETDYDPIDDDYDREQRAEYVRAMTACLTGRGYSVR